MSCKSTCNSVSGVSCRISYWCRCFLPFRTFFFCRHSHVLTLTIWLIVPPLSTQVHSVRLSDGHNRFLKIVAISNTFGSLLFKHKLFTRNIYLQSYIMSFQMLYFLTATRFRVVSRRLNQIRLRLLSINESSLRLCVYLWM